ncbi:MAG: hypothetical protein AAEB43_00340, partial [Acidimicrobiales bacterium]
MVAEVGGAFWYRFHKSGFYAGGCRGRYPTLVVGPCPSGITGGAYVNKSCFNFIVAVIGPAGGSNGSKSENNSQQTKRATS